MKGRLVTAAVLSALVGDRLGHSIDHHLERAVHGLLGGVLSPL